MQFPGDDFSGLGAVASEHGDADVLAVELVDKHGSFRPKRIAKQDPTRPRRRGNQHLSQARSRIRQPLNPCMPRKQRTSTQDRHLAIHLAPQALARQRCECGGRRCIVTVTEQVGIGNGARHRVLRLPRERGSQPQYLVVVTGLGRVDCNKAEITFG